MPINTRGIRFGTSGVPAPPDILGSADNGCKGRRLLRIGVSGLQGRDAGGLAIPHHFQHGGGCGGETWVEVMVESAEERSGRRQYGIHQPTTTSSTDFGQVAAQVPPSPRPN